MAICKKDIEQIIGLCGLHYSEEGIEIPYMFFSAFWGQGLATEAASTSLNHGFHRLGFETIIAITQEANCGSCRLLEKIGMHHLHNLWRWNATQRVYEIGCAEWLTGEKRQDQISSPNSRLTRLE